MEEFTENLAEYIRSQVHQALTEMNRKFKQIETEKMELARQISELKPQLNHLKTVATMYHENPPRPLKQVKHKYVQCNLIKPQTPLPLKQTLDTVATSTNERKITNRTINISDEPKHIEDCNYTNVIKDKPSIKKKPRGVKTLDLEGTKMDTSNSELTLKSKPTQQLADSTVSDHSEPIIITSTRSSVLPSTPSPIAASTPINPIRKENGARTQATVESTSHLSKQFKVIDLSEDESSSEERSINCKKIPLPPIIKSTTNVKNKVGDRIKAVFTISHNPANTSDEYTKVVKYEIFMRSIKQSNGLVRPTKSLGIVRPLPGRSGPIYFTADNLPLNHVYFFTICSIDELNRKGELSKEFCINC